MAKMSFEAWYVTRNLRQKRWLVGLFILLLASLLVINSFTISQFQIIPVGNNTNQGNYIEPRNNSIQETASTTVRPVQKGYVVSNKGCRIPDLSPFEPSAIRYFEKVEPIVCKSGTQLPLVNSNASAIFIDPEVRSHYYNDTEPIDCCWRSFWRSKRNDKKVTYSKDCHYFEDFAYINEEFVKVECQGKNGSVYQDYFAFVPRKLWVETRCRKQLRLEKLLNDNKLSELPTSDNKQKLSVLIVGVDSVSRLNFHRLMPRTLGIIKELGAVELYGYNKVGDNTYPNLVPVLSGYSTQELERICRTKDDETFDNCPFIWNEFRARGYRTVFGEDACWMAIFHYLKPGFSLPPTDYYLRPLCYESESKIGNAHEYNANLCVGARLAFDNLLLYTRKVAEEFADDPYFALLWEASLTHDNIDYVQLGDDHYHDLFVHLRDNELMRNTAVIFMSDHGMRWGSFRQTYQGRLEDSLPFIFFLFPDWWKQQHPQAWDNLNTNARSLTSPFDLHETLKDILEPRRLVIPTSKFESNKVSEEATEKTTAVSNEASGAAIPRGISLFKAIPDDRTCDDAGIPEHWCMCQTRYNVAHDDPVVQRVLKFLEKEINDMLAKYPQCSRLEVSKLMDAKALSHNPTTVKTTEKNFQPFWTDYSVTVEMSPSRAVFEGSIRYHADNSSMSLIDSVSRLNAYGNQSACVDDFHMRLYCYCQFN